MAGFGRTYNSSELPESRSFDPLPDGWYTATITAADVKQTRAGTGEYIALRYDILGPTHQGRVVFGNLNVVNPNPKAEEIGLAQLNDIMRAVGLASVSDSDELVGATMQIKLATEKSEQYGDKNKVTAHKAVDGSSMPVANGTTQQAAPKPAGKLPWQR